MEFEKVKKGLSQEEMLVLLIVGALEEPLRSKVKMQKIIFLIGNAIEGLHEDLGYEAHKFGPYSDSVDHMAEDLENLNYISKSGSRFTLTDKGREEYARLNPTSQVKALVENLKEFLNDMTDDEVNTYIYTFYPDYTEEATEWERLKLERIPRSKRLLKRGKVSLSIAAAMAGMSSSDFAKILREDGTKWRVV